MKTNNSKNNIVDFLVKVIKAEEYKYLRIIYAVAFVSSIIVLSFGVRTEGDTASYYSARDMILNGYLDHFRPPLYPIFLAMTNYQVVTMLTQWLIFFVSIAFLYKTLENLKISSRLIFVTMIIYACHPVLTFYQNMIYTEGLTISLSSIFIYYLVAYINTKKVLYCWIFHLLILCLILLKPGCIFLLAIPVTLLFYLFFNRRGTSILSYIFPFLLTFLLLGGYGFAIKKNYMVFSLSSVSDINLYWMLRERDKINLDAIENDEVKSFISNKVNVKYEDVVKYYLEATFVIDTYGWKELHNIVQISLKDNYMSILFDNSNIGRIRENVFSRILPTDIPTKSKISSMYSAFFPSFNFYQLIAILFFYSVLIVRQIYTTRMIPIISVLFLLYVAGNFGTLILTAPNAYSRLIIPSISVILIVYMQFVEWFVLFIQKKEKQFKLV